MAIASGNRVTATQQLEFLRRTSRILDEGRFTSTYKFAMLMALTNIAVECGSDSNDELEVDLNDLSREFVKLYWGMSRPYPALGKELLLQNRQATKPAKVVSLLAAHAAASYERHRRERRHAPSAARVIAGTRQTILRDVYWALQTVGPSANGCSEAGDRFLYDHPNTKAGCTGIRTLTLKPGVAACLRSLRGVIVAMVQARWARWIRENNPRLGPDTGLEGFMFGNDRVPIREYAPWLYELQGGRCFYTQSKLKSPDKGHVDHFLPRARYVLDEPINLVLASKRANTDKRDHVAGAEFLRNWSERNRSHAMPNVTVGNGGPGATTMNWETARGVAVWMYEAAERDNVPAWHGIGRIGRLGDRWRASLAVG
jgi:hypothetical protein